MVRPHPGMDQRGTFVVYEELVELELRLRLKSTDPVDPVYPFPALSQARSLQRCNSTISVNRENGNSLSGSSEFYACS